MRKKNRTIGIMFPDFRPYDKDTVTKTAWDWHKARHIDQCNRTDSPEINPHTNGPLFYGKTGRNIQ